MSKNIELGDLVKDQINGYSGIVFGIEQDGDKVFIHFKETNSSWQGWSPTFKNHRIILKNITLQIKHYAEPTSVETEIIDNYLTTDQKVNMIADYLDIKFETIPSKTVIQKKSVEES